MRSTDSPRLMLTDITRKLKQLNIVPTEQRLHIAEVLFDDPRHLTAREICRLVNRKSPAACRATVYNTLNLFTQRGLVREIAVDAGRTFYDPDTRPHHHFYHVDTGELIDMPPEVLPLPALPPVPSGMRATNVSLVIKIRTIKADSHRCKRSAVQIADEARGIALSA